MKKKIIALGVSAVSAATLAFGNIGPAAAAEAPPGSIIAAVCGALPASVTSLLAQLTSATNATGAANTDLLAKQAALATSVTNLVASLVTHIQTVNNGGNVTATGSVVGAMASVFSDKVVAENSAMTTWFEAQRGQYLTGISSSYIGGLQGGLC